MKDFELVDKTNISSPRKARKTLNEKSKIMENSNNSNIKNQDTNDKRDKNEDNKIEKFEEKYLEIKNNKCYNNLNRILFSKNCIFYYMIIIIISVLTLIYSILSFFIKLNEKPIYFIDIMLVFFILADMLIRIYVLGFKKYFENFLNLLDVIVILLTIISVTLYLVHGHQLNEKVEDFAVILCIIIRNSLQILRLVMFVKNQKSVKKNIEEIINFTGVLSERKFEIIPNENNDKKIKNNQALSFVYEETIHDSKKNINKKSTSKLKENEVLPDI